MQWYSVAVFPWRAVARLAAWGLVCAGAVYLAGLFVSSRILGGDDAATRSRIVADVERSFATLTTELERQARAVADPAAVRAAINEDLPATRALFDRLAQVPGVDTGDVSLSIYSAGIQPLAWAAGRPSSRLTGRRTASRGSSSRARSGCASSTSCRCSKGARGSDSWPPNESST